MSAGSVSEWALLRAQWTFWFCKILGLSQPAERL
jgi:hypothetical protein